MQRCRSRLASWGSGVMGRTARLAGALLLVAVAASGCNQSPEVDYTIPANGAVGVAGDVEIAIAFTAPLDPDTATSAANFSVRVLGEEADRELSITLEEEDRVIRIVTAEPFGTAKTVEVVLGDGIRTSANYPVDSYAFSFTTAGVTADPDTIDDRTGRFVLQSLSAVGSPATSVVPPSPILAAIAEPSAEFLNGSIQSESVQLRGSLTGVRETLLQSGTPGSVTSAGFLIRAADGEPAFEPGEEITVILGSGLTAPANSLFEPPLSLRPHVTRFEALGGAVSVPAGFGDPISFAGEGLGRPREILFADLMPTVAPDLVVAEPGGGVQVHSRFGSGGYAPVAGFEGGLLRDIEAVDLEGFGETGLLTLLRSGEVEYSRLIGGLFFLDPDFSVPVSDDRVRDLETGDLDGDGRLDAVVAAGDRVEILHNDGESGGFVVEEGPLLPGVRDVELADLDGDGRLDLVSTDGTSIRILRGSGERTFLEVALFEEPVTI
ncbi:MAG: FG-GAP-like repeat-containing protein, partial [Planctomycetota bacterium]